MRLIINGQTLDAPQFNTLADLARWMDLPDFGAAVELNGHVIRKADHPDTPLKDGDKLEIVKLVGGG